MSKLEKIFLTLCCPCLCLTALVWGCTEALLIKGGCKKDIIEEHLKNPNQHGLSYPVLYPDHMVIDLEKLDTISEQPSKEMIELDRQIKEGNYDDEL